MQWEMAQRKRHRANKAMAVKRRHVAVLGLGLGCPRAPCAVPDTFSCQITIVPKQKGEDILRSRGETHKDLKSGGRHGRALVGPRTASPSRRDLAEPAPAPGTRATSELDPALPPGSAS